MDGPTVAVADGATWCDQHHRRECSKRSKRSKVRCHKIAVAGLDACTTHAGHTNEVAKAKGAALAAWRAHTGVTDVTPGEAVLGMLQMAWARTSLYALLLEAQVDLDGGPADGPGGGTSGLIGHNYSAVKDIGIFASGEAVRGLAVLEAAERDRVVRFAKAAHDMGIAEAQVRIAEGQGRLLAEAVRRILARLDLTDTQRALVPQVVPEVLRAVSHADDN